MRARVSVTTLQRVERLERFRSRTRPRADYPPMLDVDTWESIAQAQQARLMGGHGEIDTVIIAAVLKETH